MNLFFIQKYLNYICRKMQKFDERFVLQNVTKFANIIVLYFQPKGITTQNTNLNVYNTF